ERAVHVYLTKPEIERLWTLKRDGKEIYNRKFGHTLTRDRSNLFPNAWWAIDGTKLDLIHYADNKQKMATELVINLCFDVYSETIIGWDLALSENHASHFRTLKMAANKAGAKPYLFTYDHQSGHKSSKMQELYSRLIAEGGQHYPHQVKRHSNPAEQIINRFQQQKISKMWFSDKQSVKVRRDDNRPNIDFIMEFKEALPTMSELTEIVDRLVNEWNQAGQRKLKHTREELFNQEAGYR